MPAAATTMTPFVMRIGWDSAYVVEPVTTTYSPARATSIAAWMFVAASAQSVNGERWAPSGET